MSRLRLPASPEGEELGSDGAFSGLGHIDNPRLPKGLPNRALQQILVAEFLYNELF
jgi:hypothetical protein